MCKIMEQKGNIIKCKKKEDNVQKKVGDKPKNI